jgi:hypothetical protein
VHFMTLHSTTPHLLQHLRSTVLSQRPGALRNHTPGLSAVIVNRGGVVGALSQQGRHACDGRHAQTVLCCAMHSLERILSNVKTVYTQHNKVSGEAGTCCTPRGVPVMTHARVPVQERSSAEQGAIHEHSLSVFT